MISVLFEPLQYLPMNAQIVLNHALALALDLLQSLLNSRYQLRDSNTV